MRHKVALMSKLTSKCYQQANSKELHNEHRYKKERYDCKHFELYEQHYEGHRTL